MVGPAFDLVGLLVLLNADMAEEVILCLLSAPEPAVTPVALTGSVSLP